MSSTNGMSSIGEAWQTEVNFSLMRCWLGVALMHEEWNLWFNGDRLFLIKNRQTFWKESDTVPREK